MAGHKMTHVVIVSRNDETRLLLRGLLRLHHIPVPTEGSSVEGMTDLIAAGDHAVLLLDVDLEEKEWVGAVRSLRERCSELRVVLLTPSRSPRVDALAKEAGVSTVLRRPFAVHELIDAVTQANGPVPH